MANNKDFKVKNGIKPTVYHEAVGTVTSASITNYLQLSSASYTSNTTTTSGETEPRAIWFKSDGSVMYAMGMTGDDINYYNLSTNWDVSSAVHQGVALSVSSEETSPQAMYIDSTGSYLFVLGYSSDTVHKYTMSTPWDLANASLVSADSLDVSAKESIPTGVWFKSDGSVMYITGQSSDAVHQYNLSTNWDPSSGTFDSSFYYPESDNPNGFYFSDNGDYLIALLSGVFYRYPLTTAWDISTASTADQSYDPSSQDSLGNGMYIGNSGAKLYLLGGFSDTVYEYDISTTTNTNTLDLSTGSVFEITPTSDIQIGLSNPAASGTVSAATLLLDGAAGSTYDIANASHYGNMSIINELTSPEGMEISSDGTKIYVVGRTTDKVFEYVLSTPWDVTTGSYNSVEFSVLSQTTYPTDIAFKSDGTKMYICTSAEDKVFQYSLSTAWDLSTASYDSVSFDTSNEENNVQALAFSNDGTKMYTAGLEFDNVVEYDLSTAWNVSTASYNSVTLSTSSQTTTPDGLFFNADGTSLYVISSALDQVLQYDMTTAFDLSTASYTTASASLNANAVTGKGGRFDNTGTRMYIVDNGADNVTQWTVGSTATITYDSTLEFAGGTAPTSPAIGETDVITISTRDGGTTYQAVQAIDGAS